jgi:catechol 2,3-dioxygenase-like lactoylglutathione lyase family enzyme
MTIRRVVPNLLVPDLVAARAFFVDVLGFEVAMDLGWIVTFASPSNPTAQLSVSEGEPRPDPGGAPHLTVEVADVNAVHATAQAQGVQVVYPLTDEPWGVRRCFVEAPGGWVLNVMSQPS